MNTALRAARRLVRGVWNRSYVAWRRSIQVRVVTITLVISAIVVAVLGVFLMQQITAALLNGKSETAMQQLGEGVNILRTKYLADPNAGDLTEEVASELNDRSAPSGLYQVYVVN